MPLPHVSLVPPLLRKDEIERFVQSGRTLSAAVSPRGNTLATFAAKSKGSRILDADSYPSDIYFVSWDNAPSDSRRKLLSETFVTFIKFNKTLGGRRSWHFDEEPNEEDLIRFNGLADEYLISLKMEKERLDDENPWPEAAVAHTETLYAAFSLFQTSHLPSNGSLDGLVGEELLEWLNTNFIAPDSEEGIELNKLSSPWDEDGYWRYLIRCILRGLSQTALIFFEGLKRHPSGLMKQQAETIIALLSTHPRSNKFAEEKEFFYYWKQWKGKVIAFGKKLDELSDEEGEDWLPWLSEIARIMEGDKETIIRYCESYEEGWKEAICVWGVWIDVGLRRYSVLDVVTSVLEDLPHDPTLVEENFFVAIFTGQLGEALRCANELDIWLAAHMADMMQPLGLLLDTGDGAELSIRDHLLLTYAEYLLVDPSLWRIAVLYMCECGEAGKRRADEVLLRTPLDLGQHKIATKDKPSGDPDRMETGDEGKVDTRVIEILEICKEHNRENVRREICEIAARTLAEQRRYPLAISYYISAEDWQGVGRIVDLILELSIIEDQIDLVDSVREIAQVPQDCRPYNQYGKSVFQHRLKFLLQYADFHQKWSNGDIHDAAGELVVMFLEELVPKSWWGILLKQAGELLSQDAAVMPFDVLEIFELLRRLEEIQSSIEQGSGAEYLNALMRRLKKGGQQEALRQLESVRLAMARYIARCSVLDVGGKGNITIS